VNEKERKELLKKVEEYSKKIEKNPNDASNYFMIGRIYEYLENYDKAEKFYEKAKKLKSNNPYYYYYLAMSYLYLENYDKACNTLFKFIKLNPNNICEKKYNISNIISEKDSTKIKAIQSFNEGIKYFYSKDYEKAIKKFKEATTIYSDYPHHWYYYAKAYEYLDKSKEKDRNLKKASEFYEKVLELNSNHILTYYRKALINKHFKNYKEVCQDLKKVIELFFTNASSYYNHAFNNFKNLKYNEAIKDFNSSIELNPIEPHYYYCRGLSHFYLNHYNNAIEDFSSTIELNFHFIYNALYYNTYYCESLYYRFIMYLNLGEYDKAIRDYNEFIKLDSKKAMRESIDTLILDLKNIKSLYSAGDFKETKKKINSLRQYAEDLIVHLKESKAITCFSNKDTQKVLNGYLTFADILGWKGIWKKQNSDDEKVDTLNTLLFIKHKLEEEFKEEEENYKINLISDTYVIFSKNFQINGRLSKRLIELCLKNDLLIRGATSYGKFYNNDMVYIGQAVDEAASWHEKGEEIGIFYTSSAKLSIKEENSIEYELKNSYLKKGTIKTKLGEIKTYYINWYNKETKKDFYRIMKDEVISPDISSKYLNTEESIEKHLNVKSNKLLRSNKYVKNR